MRFQPFPLVLSCALTLAGCGSVASQIDGHSVTGKCLVYAELVSDGHAANVNLDGRKLQVTTSQITWAKGGSLQLPAAWTRLDLADAVDSVEVTVDGRII